MATIILGTIGTVAGAVFGGPLGARIGMAVGTLVGSLIDNSMAKVPKTERGKLDDLHVGGSSYGNIIPQVWGKARTAGNIIWATKLVERRREQEVGGKGTPTADIVTYSYFGNFAVSLCKGPIDHVQRIWADDLLIYDASKAPTNHYDLAIYLGGETQLPDPTMEAHDGIGNVPAYRGQAYVVFNMLPLRKWGNRLPSISAEVVSLPAAEVSCATIMGDCFGQAGLANSQFDSSGAAVRTVTGMILNNRTPARDVVEALMQVTGIDICEVDGVIKTVARGGAVEVTVPWADLGADFFDPNNEAVSEVTFTRVNDLELPSSVEVQYYATAKKYENGSQIAIRYTKGNVDGKQTLNTPLSLTETKARQYAEYCLYTQWIERTRGKLVLPPKYLRYTPGTVLSVPLDSAEAVHLRCRIISQDYALFGPIETAVVQDDTNIIDQRVAGGDFGDLDPDDLLDPTTVAFIPFCCNALLDEHADAPGYYLAAAGQDGWTGVQVYRSRAGNAYKPAKYLGDSATYGTAGTVLAAGSDTGTVDYVHTVDIVLQTGAVETTDMDNLLSGVNAALLGDEVIQFLTVTALGGTSFRLSGLLRGQRGTDYAWGTHAIGDRFILLEPSTVFRVSGEHDLIGKTINFKAITESQQLADVAAVPLTVTGQELKPWSPVDIAGTRDGSLNLTVNWTRRARKSGELEDFYDVDLDEPYERYDVEIWDSTYTTLKRTFASLTTPTCSYSAANQTTDFGATQAVVYVKVYQLGDFQPGTTTSRMRGYPGIASV